jgi:phenylacetate-CoA ligase
VLKTELQQLYFRANTFRDHLWHKRDLGARMASIVDLETLDQAAYPDGETLPRWGNASNCMAGGSGHLLNLVTKVHLQAEWLQRVQPTYLMSFPSNLEALARYCREKRISYPTRRQLRTLSEPVKPEVRELCREVFGCEIKDTYSTEEIGYIGFESPVSHELLTVAETVLVEIIDEAGRPCAPGEVGRVVVTPLHAFAMPLIRYAVGDLAEVDGPAACGRGLPVIARVLGRERQIVRLPNGQLLYPSYHYLTRGLDKIIQFQIARKGVELLEVRLVTRPPLSGEEEADLRTRVRERFQYPFEVSFAYVEEISRSRSGKYFDYVSEVD